MSDPISLREYARRRGVSAKSVVMAIRSGRLSASITRTDKGPKVADADLADREWDANTDLTRAPGYVKEREAARAAGDEPTATAAKPTQAGPTLSLGDASALVAEWKAKLAELDFRERSGQLVDAQALEGKLVEAHTRARTKLLGMVAKLKTLIPHLTRAELVIIDGLIRETLEELASDEPPSAAEGE